MGLEHSWRQEPGGGSSYPYAIGYGVDRLFATIMAYRRVFQTQQIAQFSDPTRDCKGVPCGVPRNQNNPADAVYALNQNKHIFAAFAKPIAFDGPTQFTLPAKVEAENYVSATDTTVGNTGSAFRFEDTDIQATEDTGGGYNVGWIEDGESLSYNICLLYTSPSPRDLSTSRMPSSA